MSDRSCFPFRFQKIAIGVTLTFGLLFMTSQPNLVVVGRVLAGLTHGLTLLTTLIHAAEITSDGIQRHKLLSTVGFVLAYSYLLPAIILVRSAPANVSNIIIGAQCAVLSVCAFVINSYFTKESPSYVLMNGDPSSEVESTAAFELFKYLRSDTVPAGQLPSEFFILKSHVISEKRASPNIIASGNFRVLLLCAATRLVSVFSFNFAVAYFVILFQNLAFYGAQATSFPLILLYLICGSITTLFIVKQRKRLYLMVIAFGFIHTALGICLLLNFKFMDLYVNALPLFVGVISGFIYVYCFALPSDILSLINLSEAFSLSKRPASIAIVLAFEYLIHLVMAWLAILEEDIAVWLIVSIGVMFCGIVSHVWIPRKTIELSLETCPDAYKSKSQ